ncbi:hypothetical protein KC19_10G046300 [Ceratodon purpureus]|uniref:Cyclic nucleotide-binding domain-containing protein n=1 Tax=Ceratodon purpureus TaxID=3225 RepID=A0A8T0GI50_CERPU|nr:hypothetical protein KC19_10G046300 [Ceratodon purpureus]
MVCRFRSDLDTVDGYNSDTDVPLNRNNQQFSVNSRGSAVRRGLEKGTSGIFRLGQSLKLKGANSSQVYDDSDPKPGRKTYLDPTSLKLQRWNTFFVFTCLVAVFVDPLFYYLPYVDNDRNCVSISVGLKKSVTVFRTITDFFYIVHMFLQFRTAYIAPSSRVFGRGELVTDPKKIAARYLRKDFWVDLVAVLPVPQFMIWVVIPNLTTNTPSVDTKNALRFIVFLQYLPRLFRLFPLTSKIINTTGVLMETAWAGAAFNLLLYMLASHVVGACWYILAVERQYKCWSEVCSGESLCQRVFLDCFSVQSPNPQRDNWLNITVENANCSSGSFNYGIYQNAIDNNITSEVFLTRYFYSLWLGLLALSSLTQTLSVSTYGWEIIFDILIIIAGLLLFAFLIGNMQTYLQSLTLRLEEMRVKRRDSEQWMRHRNLPHDIVQRVRRYDQYKWVATRGVNEEMLVQSLPSDLRRDIKRHLCLNLVRNVPFFDQMDESLLDAMCERLKTALCTEGTIILREGDPVNEMLFIIRGTLESMTTNGGRSGFFNYGVLKAGDFCGEELLTWALDPKPQSHLPISTHTVKAVMEVEAFSLSSDDLKFVASQFRRLHSKQLQHTFRYYSHHWRTWAASFIQAAWRRYQRRRLAELRRSQEDQYLQEAMQSGAMPSDRHSLGATILAGKFAKNAMRGVQRLRSMQAAELARISNIPKPAEPDFSLDS